MQLRDIISQYDPPYRGDCPKCGAKHTFSLNRVDGEIAFNCYSASCGLKGIYKTERSFEELNTWGSYEDNSSESVKKEYHFQDVRSNDKAYRQVKDYSCVQDGRVEVKYDPVKDRLIFMNDTIVIGKGKMPKWLVYEGSTEVPFLIRNYRGGNQFTGILVLVEDCISACAVAEFVDAAALMGTKLSLAAKTLALQYPVVYIALDPDAYSNAHKIAKQLVGLCEVKVLLLPSDPKDMTTEQLQEYFQ